MTVKDVTRPVHAFGWKSNPINWHSLKTAGICGTVLAFAVACLIAERNDQTVITFAWALLLITLAVIVARVWPYLTIRGTVLEIASNGVLDRRKLVAPVRWRDVNELYTNIESTIVDVRVRPSRQGRVQKRGLGGLWQAMWLGSGNFVIALAMIETGDQDIGALCRDYLKADKRERVPAAIAALEGVAASSLQGAALDQFIEAIRDVPLLIPIFEEQQAQTLDIVEEDGGRRVMQVFTDSPRYYTVTPQDYYSPMFIDELLRAAPVYRFDAIVINPRVGPELRIERERFEELSGRLRDGEVARPREGGGQRE